MDTTNEGYVELNKKLCVIETLKCYIEHLSLFHKFELLLPPSVASMAENIVESEDANGAAVTIVRNKNYISEMSVNLKVMQSRWVKRRQEQGEANENLDDKYPFTYMIDCIIEECKNYANTCSMFTQHVDNPNSLIYPPKSINVFIKSFINFKIKFKK